MSRRNHIFVQSSLQNIELKDIQIYKKQSVLYTNSSTKLDEGSMEMQMIKEKYQNQYNKFHKTHHKRSKSHIQKIQKIIKDANDLNEILHDHNQWLSKRHQKKQKGAQTESKMVFLGSGNTKQELRWRPASKIILF